MKDTARAAAAFGVTVVNGFTGSPVWHLLYSFPPNDFDAIARGLRRVRRALGPIIDVFDAEGVRFALEVHPTEIAYDFVTTQRALAAIGRRPASGQPRPSHFAHQFLDTAAFAIEFADRIYHVHVKDSGTARRAQLHPGRAPQLREPHAAGTSSHPVTATSTSSRSSELSTASGTRARSRSSGRTRNGP